MGQERLIHKIGAPVTRALLSPRLRGTALGRGLYTRLYLLGKSLAERREVRFLRGQVRPGMVVFDVGANLGFYTLLLAGRVGPEGRVHAFEPDPLSFDILRRRAAGRANVETERTAVGDQAGTITLYTSRSNRADNRVHPSLDAGATEAVEVPLTTLDGYCAARGIERIDAVKMDIQGAEVAALSGFRETLARLKPRWMLIEFSPEHLRGAGSSPEAFWQMLGELGYEPWGFGEDGEAFRIEDTGAFTRRYESGYTDVWARRDLPQQHR
ncbi:MAG TPA: FkbM family methyltransferase [Thermoanaerobaculia bacterium]|nr:FkbM family methyltransferase [Thermoanaerobaculia bacterium]